MPSLLATFRAAQQQSFEDQMKGEAFNLAMDKETRSFWGSRANIAFNTVLGELDQHFPARVRYKGDTEEQFRERNPEFDDVGNKIIYKNDFNVYGGTRDETFSIEELYTIYEAKIDKEIKAGKYDDADGYKPSEAKRKDLIDSHMTSVYVNPSGLAAATIGPNKMIARLNYDRESRTITPEVNTYDYEMGQVHRDPFTDQGGLPISEGGKPVSIPLDPVGGFPGANAIAQRYMLNARSEGGFDIISSKASKLLTTLPTRPDGGQEGGDVFSRIGGITQFSPDQVLANRLELEDSVTPSAVEGSPSVLGLGGVGTAGRTAGPLVEEPTGPPVEEPTGPPVEGTSPVIPEGSTGPEPEAPVEAGAPLWTPRVTDWRTGRKDPLTGEMIPPRPYDTEQLHNFMKGPNTTGPDRINRLLGGSDYVHDDDVTPYGLLPEQWDGFSSRDQKRITDRSIAASEHNVSTGFAEGLKTQDIGKLNFFEVEDPLTGEVKEPTTYGSKGSGTIPEFTIGKGTIESQVAAWENRHGDIIPLEEGMSKADTLVAVQDFYASSAKKGTTIPKDGTIHDISIEEVMQKHPAYYLHFREIGAVEFARRYMNDPEFAKNRPTREQQAVNKREINGITKELAIDKNEGERLLAAIYADDPSRFPERTVKARGARTSTFKEFLDIPKPVKTATENSIAVLLNGAADRNISEIDLRYMSPQQRLTAGSIILGSLPEGQRANFAPKIEALIRYGMMKTELDRIPTPNQIATALNQAYRTDAMVDESRRATFQNIIDTEQREADRLSRERGQDITLRSQDMMRRGQDIQAALALAQRGWTVANHHRDDQQQAIKDQTEYEKYIRKTLTDAFSGSKLAEEVGAGNVDIFSHIRGLSTADLVREGVYHSPEFATSVNLASQLITTAKTPGQLLAAHTFVDNALFSMLRAGASNDFRIFMGIKGLGLPAVANWWAELVEWWKGTSRQAGTIAPRFVAVGDDGAVINDMALVYHPTMNREGGVRIKKFLMLMPDGREVEGKPISPGTMLRFQGNALYNIMLAQAVNNANRLRYGGD